MSGLRHVNETIKKFPIFSFFSCLFIFLSFINWMSIKINRKLLFFLALFIWNIKQCDLFLVIQLNSIDWCGNFKIKYMLLLWHWSFGKYYTQQSNKQTKMNVITFWFWIEVTLNDLQIWFYHLTSKPVCIRHLERKISITSISTGGYFIACNNIVYGLFHCIKFSLIELVSIELMAFIHVKVHRKLGYVC